MKPPYAIGSVPSLSGHAIAYRWRSLPRVRRHRASKPQGSSERVLPWQITMDQLIFASLSHTHYWYEVGMLKVPAVETKEKPTPVVCEEQGGPLSQARLHKDNAFSTNLGTSSLRRVDRLPSREGRWRITERQQDGWTPVLTASPEHTQGENYLINRTNFECSPRSLVPGSLKCFTQARRASTLREKGERETPHNEGTGTEPKESTW